MSLSEILSFTDFEMGEFQGIDHEHSQSEGECSPDRDERKSSPEGDERKSCSPYTERSRDERKRSSEQRYTTRYHKNSSDRERSPERRRQYRERSSERRRQYRERSPERRRHERNYRTDQKRPKVCAFFNTIRGCKNGSTCGFAHDQTLISFQRVRPCPTPNCKNTCLGKQCSDCHLKKAKYTVRGYVAENSF